MEKLNSSEPAISVRGISKTYLNGKKQIKALSDISLTIQKGSLFGLIGPDGAGKTSLFRILTTLLLFDGGSANVDGFDVITDYKAIRKRIGYMPGRFSLYMDLTVEENLQLFASIFNTTVAKNFDLIKDIYVQIEPFKKRRAGKLSGGMKQKLALCCALIHQPSVLFLDEPTTGVDAVSRKEFWEMLQSLKKKGITILVSTPYMDEANLCDQVALIQNGKILQVNTPHQIIHQFVKPIFEVKGKDMLGLLADLKTQSSVDHIYPFGEYRHLIPTGPLQDIVFPEETFVQQVKPNIEDVFIELMRSHE